MTKSFVSSKKVSTFAVPFGNERVFNAQNRKAGTLKITKSSLKRLKGKYKQVPEVVTTISNLNERQFLRKLECLDKLRFIKIYNEEFDPGSG